MTAMRGHLITATLGRARTAGSECCAAAAGPTARKSSARLIASDSSILVGEESAATLAQGFV